jgi:hypothetical protein
MLLSTNNELQKMKHFNANKFWLQKPSFESTCFSLTYAQITHHLIAYNYIHSHVYGWHYGPGAYDWSTSAK